jgi:hypothetical protein
MAKKINLEQGQRFGRYTFIEDDISKRQSNGKLVRYVKAKCDCGIIKSIQLAHLRNGMVVSCGCFHKENAIKIHTTHNEDRQSITEYTTWQGMKQRCNNPNSISYPNYGALGIKVCDEWNDYINFLKDMGRKPGPEYTLDRIDGTKGYSKDNCRWETRSVQNSNRRPYTRTKRKLNE